jgi:hypothetical protein
MKSRCLNANIANYDRYGGRGIGICNAWAESFERFAADMGEPPSKTHSIDRINNDGDYEPGNCRWATPKEQARNSSSVSLIAAFGEIKSLVEWSEDPRCGTTLSALRHRLSRRWLPESAIVAAPNVKKRSAPWPQQ